jgi:hypothetical protein
MKKLFHFFLSLLLVLGISQASAQTKKTSTGSKGKSEKSSSGRSGGGGSAGYKTAIGLRGGNYSSGLTIKHFFNAGKNAAAEALVTTEYRAKGARFTLLLEKHWTIVPDVKNLQWYVGAGLHAGAYRGRYYYAVAYRYKKKRDYYVYYTGYDDKVYPVFGADFVLGLEYKIPDLPLVISADYKPYFDVFDGNTGVYQDAAVSVRFSF